MVKVQKLTSITALKLVSTSMGFLRHGFNDYNELFSFSKAIMTHQLAIKLYRWRWCPQTWLHYCAVQTQPARMALLSENDKKWKVKNMKNFLQKANSNLKCNVHLGIMFRQLLPPIKTHYISYKCFFWYNFFSKTVYFVIKLFRTFSHGITK